MTTNEQAKANGEKIRGEMADFIKHLHEKYGVGHGCIVMELNDEVTMGSLFGDIKTFDEETEKSLMDAMKSTIEGGAKEAKRQYDEKKSEIDEVKKKIAEKVADIVCDMLTLDEKKAKAWKIAKEMEFVKDGKIDEAKLAELVKKNGGDDKEYETAKSVLQELIEEHKDE